MGGGGAGGLKAQREEREFLGPDERGTRRRGRCRKIHPKASRDCSLLPLTYLLLFELNQKAGSRGANVMHFIDMHRAGLRRMGGEA